MRSIPRRLKVMAVAVPALALVVSACGSDGSDSGSGDGSASGSVTIYSGRDQELIDPLIDMMRDATGLDIEVRYGDTSQMANQIVTEGDRAKADLFIAQDAGALGLLVREGLLAELPSELTERVAEDYRDGGDHWVGLSGRSRVFAYDPEDVDELPESVLDLTGPEWEGRVGFAPTNGSFQAFVTALRAIEGDDVAQQWLKDMAANDVRLYDNNRSQLDALENGEIDLSLNNHYYWYERVAELGEDAVTSELHYLTNGDAGGLVNVAGAGVLASAGNPEGAQAALEYLLGDEAQTFFSEHTYEYPLVPGIELAEGLVELDSLQQPDIDLSDLSDLDTSIEMIREAGLE